MKPGKSRAGTYWDESLLNKILISAFILFFAPFYFLGMLFLIIAKLGDN